MVKFNSVEEFAEFTDIETLLDVQYHVNRALEQIRKDSLNKGAEGTATANISIALFEDYFLLIEFNFSWKNEVFQDEEKVTLTLMSLDEWLDYYNLHKNDFKVVKSHE